MQVKLIGLVQENDPAHPDKPRYIAMFDLAKTPKDTSLGKLSVFFFYVPMLDIGEWYDLSFIEEIL